MTIFSSIKKLREAQEILNNPQYNNYTFKYLTLETTEGPSIEEINSMGNNNQYVSPTTMDLDENIKDIIVTDIDVKEYVENKFYKKEKKLEDIEIKQIQENIEFKDNCFVKIY